MHDRILILDFGSQVTQLIARRVREAHVYCEIHPCEVSDAFVREFAPKGVILSGSHMSAWEESTDRAPQAVFELGVPVLGICYGMQTMAQQLGGKVERGQHREFGYAEVRARGHTKLLDGIEDFRTPEGSYRLTRRNAKSDFFLAVQVSYPEATDIALARKNGWAPGGAIMVHGLPNLLKYSRDRYLSTDWTDGCIALSNEDMLDFWLLTGLGTPIEIRP